MSNELIHVSTSEQLREFLDGPPSPTRDFYTHEATLEDKPSIVQSVIDLARITEGRTLNSAEVAEGIDLIFCEPHLPIVVAKKKNKRKGTFAGMAIVSGKDISTFRGCRVWLMGATFVVKEMRRQGILRALYTHLCSLAHAEGIAELHLLVDETNERGRQAYDHIGFDETSYRFRRLTVSTLLQAAPAQQSHPSVARRSSTGAIDSESNDGS